MRFSFEWLDGADNSSLEERATVADLRIEVGGKNACVSYVNGGTLDTVTLPLVHLTYAFAKNWWRIFGSRDVPFRLIDWRMGFATPDIRISFDGVDCVIEAHYFQFENPPIHFLGNMNELLDRSSIEESFTFLIESSIERLKSKNLYNTSLENRWALVMGSRKDPQEASYCEAAGALGADPYQILDSEHSLIEEASNRFEGEVLIEYLAGLRGESNKNQTAAWIANVHHRSKHESEIPAILDLSRAARSSVQRRASERAYAIGYRAARVARRRLDLGSEWRFGSLTGLTEKLGASSFQRAAGQPALRAYIHRRAVDDVRIHIPGKRSDSRSATPAACFAFTRAVGDAICFSETEHAVVNKLKNAERQAVGRAFAAEFLAPIDEILSMKNDGRDIDSIAEDLYVDTEVVERQLENKERILEACQA